MHEDEIAASLILNCIKDVGPALFQKLVTHFGSAQGAVKAGPNGWRAIAGLEESFLERVKAEFEQTRREAEEDLKLSQKEGVRILLCHEGPYPPLLRELSSAPPIIYALGEDICVERPAVALVGSRRCSYYGEKVAKRVAAELAEAGVTTVSGLARGIDTHVHRGTLEAGGKTWAVIGSGLASLYPPENRALAKHIESSGAVISEFPMKTVPHPANFPRRNRIIAGISLGTVVIEGGPTSGALITARLAAEEGREVFAVPGPAHSLLSAAPHGLLRAGAKLTETARDILEEFSLEDRLKFQDPGNPPEADAVQARYAEVLTHLTEWPTPKEILAQRLKKEAKELASLLLEMELKGLVRSLPGGLLVKL